MDTTRRQKIFGGGSPEAGSWIEKETASSPTSSIIPTTNISQLIHIAATLNCEHARMTTAPTRWIFDQVHSRKPLPTESASVKNQKTQYAYCEVLMPQYLAMLKDPEGIPRAWGRAPGAIEAEAIAKIELEAYRDAKRTGGDHYLATAKYTLECHTVEEWEAITGNWRH